MVPQTGNCLFSMTAASFGYGKQEVIGGASVTIEAGEFIAVMGPNGSGKTTFMRGVLGLLEPRSGHVDRADTRLGYVPQRESLDRLFPLTVLEVVRMGAFGRLRHWRTRSRSDEQLCHHMLERVGLAGSESKPFSSLSGGQRQRALMARALVMQPQLLVLDEPTSGVDQSAAEGIRDLLLSMVREEGLAILLVSHQLEFVRACASRALWVADGRVTEKARDSLLPNGGVEALLIAGKKAANKGIQA